MTLAESLVALVIIGIGLVGLASVVPLSSWGIQEGNQMTTSVFLAEQRLEQVKGMRWTAADAGTGLVANDCLGSSGTRKRSTPAPMFWTQRRRLASGRSSRGKSQA